MRSCNRVALLFCNDLKNKRLYGIDENRRRLGPKRLDVVFCGLSKSEIGLFQVNACLVLLRHNDRRRRRQGVL